MPYAAGDACTPFGEQPLAAIILKWPSFAAAFDDVTFRDLSGSAFVETGPPPSVDLTTGSTFVNVAGCKQIVSKANDGTCPDPAPCAK